MKILKIGFFLLLVLFLTYTGYIFKFQQLVNEGSVIADKQCINVNPLIIQRKNSYLKSMKIIMDKGSIEDYLKELDNYIDISNKFITEQGKWLKEQKAHMNRWNYKFLIPSEIKELGRLQYISRETDMKGTKAILDMLKTTDVNRQKEYMKIIIDQTKLGKDADNEYDRIWKKGFSPDLTMRFVKVPPSKCPKENFNIPNVPDLLLPPTRINYGPLSQIPYNQYIVS